MKVIIEFNTICFQEKIKAKQKGKAEREREREREREKEREREREREEEGKRGTASMILEDIEVYWCSYIEEIGCSVETVKVAVATVVPSARDREELNFGWKLSAIWKDI